MESTCSGVSGTLALLPVRLPIPHLISLSLSYQDPTHIDTLLASLMKHSVNGGSSSSSSSSSEEVMSGIMQLNENALEAARARVRSYGKNPKHWRVWLPSDVWAKFSMLKVYRRAASHLYSRLPHHVALHRWSLLKCSFSCKN